MLFQGVKGSGASPCKYHREPTKEGTLCVLACVEYTRNGGGCRLAGFVCVWAVRKYGKVRRVEYGKVRRGERGVVGAW